MEQGIIFKSILDPFLEHPTQDSGLTKSAGQGCSLTPYSPRPFPVPKLPRAAPSSALQPSSMPCCGTKPVLRKPPHEQVSAAQSSPAMRGIPAAEPSREIHLCRPDSEELFGAKHCAIKWR